MKELLIIALVVIMGLLVVMYPLSAQTTPTEPFSPYVSEIDAVAPGNPVQDDIIIAAAQYHLNPNLLVAIATCESHLRVDAANPLSTASGIFQFLTSTFEHDSIHFGIMGFKNDPVV